MIVTPLEIIVKDGVTTTTGALKMMETDPHGITMSIVAISVVFSCLLILFCVYSLMGYLFTRKDRRPAGAGLSASGVGSTRAGAAGLDPKTVGCADPTASGSPSYVAEGGTGFQTNPSAPAPESESEIAAAIGLALHLYLGGNHDVESGFITIDNQYQSAWADKGRGFRKIPVRQ